MSIYTAPATSATIVDGSIVDADVNASAAIAGTKISPNFGSQNVVTTGTSTAASLIPTGSSVPANGMYLPSANNLSFSTNSTQRMLVDSSGRLLVGTSTNTNNARLAQNLALVATGAGNLGGLSLTNYGFTSALTSSVIDFNRSNGTADGSLTLVSSGGRLGVIAFRGADGSAFIDSAFIEAYVDGTPGLNDMPGRLVFSTTADGATAPTERMRINNAGKILLGTTTAVAGETVRVGGSIRASNTAAVADGVFNATDSVYEIAASLETINFGRLQGVVNSSAVGDSTISVRFLTESGWLTAGGNGKNCILKLYQSLQHANSGNFDIKEQHYHFLYKQSSTSALAFPTTPAYTDSATGQTNESATMTLSNPTFRGTTQGTPYYVQFDLALGSGRTNPLHQVFYELIVLGR